MQRDKRAESLNKNDRIVFANKTLEVKKVVRFEEGGITKVRVSLKGFRDVEFNIETLVTVID